MLDLEWSLVGQLAAGSPPPEPHDCESVIVSLAKEVIRRRSAHAAMRPTMALLRAFSEEMSHLESAPELCANLKHIIDAWQAEETPF